MGEPKGDMSPKPERKSSNTARAAAIDYFYKQIQRVKIKRAALPKEPLKKRFSEFLSPPLEATERQKLKFEEQHIQRSISAIPTATNLSTILLGEFADKLRLINTAATREDGMEYAHVLKQLLNVMEIDGIPTKEWRANVEAALSVKDLPPLDEFI